jgi:ATP-binding cassette subfamily B protein
MTRLAIFLKKYTLQIIVIVALTLVQVMVNLQLPDYMSKIVNEGIIQENNDLIFNVGIEMLLISLVGGIATIFVSFFASKVSTGAARDIREKVFHKVSGFSLNEFDKFSTSSLITRTTNDIQQVQMVAFLILRMVVSAPIMGIWAVIKAYNKAPSMSWIIGLAIGIIIVMIVTIFIVAIPKFKMVQKLIDKLNLVTREGLTGMRVIRAFNTQQYEEKKFFRVNTELTNVNLFINRVMVIMQPFVMMILSMTSIAIVWFGAQLISTNDLAIGDMMAFMQYAMQALMSFFMITMVFILIPRASVSGNRINEVLKIKPKINDIDNPIDFNKELKGRVEFKDVSFSYPHSDTPVLKNISFIANPGKITAFIGSTGSGKSTLINLIPRFYDVTEGQILIDGIDIREVAQKKLNNKIGYIPQKGILFSGSIESNVKFGKESATDDEVIRALTISQAYEFVSKMESGIKAHISQSGKNISGGQKQRISIARAILKDPDIYIFDDSFSALDYKTDMALRDALAKEITKATVLIVGQRISTIMHADNIIVINEGKIVGQGTHDELMRTCDVYKEIALSQLSVKELSNV